MLKEKRTFAGEKTKSLVPPRGVRVYVVAPSTRNCARRVCHLSILIMADQEIDNLGLDKPIKLGRVSRIPKITDELLFDRTRGLPPVIANYPKLSRTIKKNDRKLGEKLKKGAFSKHVAHLMKVEAEVKNLESVLQFYQLWCHGLFPRATFADCIKMLRNYKSFRLKEYRRELISQQIHRLKVENGLIIDDGNASDNQSDDDLYQPNNDIAAVDVADPTHTVDGADVDDDDEDDWGFLAAPRRSNGLFIGDDEDEEEDIPLPTNTHHSTEKTTDPTETVGVGKPQAARSNPASSKNNLIEEEYPEEELNQAEEPDSQYDEEYEIMRQMGM